MTKQEKELKEYIIKQISYFSKEIGYIPVFTFTVLKNGEDKKHSMSTVRKEDGGTHYEFYWHKDMMDYWKAKNYYWIKRIIAHELSHILLWKLSNQTEERFLSESDYKEELEKMCNTLGLMMLDLVEKKPCKATGLKDSKKK